MSAVLVTVLVVSWLCWAALTVRDTTAARRALRKALRGNPIAWCEFPGCDQEATCTSTLWVKVNGKTVRDEQHHYCLLHFTTHEESE